MFSGVYVTGGILVGGGIVLASLISTSFIVTSILGAIVVIIGAVLEFNK